MGKANRGKKGIRVTTQAEADARAGILVCSRTRYFDDDRSATCRQCDRMVYFRPHAPVPKDGYYCLDCATPIMRHTDTEILATTTSVKELLLDIMTEAQTQRH